MYYIGIDETGTTIKFENRIKRVKLNNEKNKLNNNESKFILTFILMTEREYVHFKKIINNFKKKFNLFDANIHASSIFSNKKFFNKEKQKLFLKELQEMIDSINFNFYYSIVNVKDHIHKYKKPFDPYQISLQRIIERIIIDTKEISYSFFVEGRNNYEDYNSRKTILKTLFKSNYFSFEDLKIYFINKRSNNYNSIVELADFVSYILRQKIIKKSHFFNQNRFEYFSDYWIENFIKSKMKHKKEGYDILKI